MPVPLYVVIRGWGSISALGHAGLPPTCRPAFRLDAASGLSVAALPAAAETALDQLRRSRPAYRALDRSVLLALWAAQQATAQAGWQPDDARPLAVSMGSSRGASERLETFHAEFLRNGTSPTAASPLTTLGNVASWVADAAGAAAGAISHSSTCSTALQALGNAVAWLRAGMAERFLAGGTEAPLTAFTLAQMQALGIYSALPPDAYPCRPGAGGSSSFVLGEGAAVLALEATTAEQLRPGDLLLESVGFGFEATGTKTGLTPHGLHFQQAMRQALAQAGRLPTDVDLILLHSPGTAAGDAAERAAVEHIFGADGPACTSNKWLLGHTLGASAALSLDFALHVLQGRLAPSALPFESWLNMRLAPQRVRRILVNAAGFGGNAASALVSVAS
ncbi:beta-ketoacyl-ACP reductase [Hymenobacter busanensis]|uniref:Beta-ketoacyl-ACP reductase n=1 Tax=Hymenobacter busanensis TaxID=2607656 RepID=A0A7L4ZVA6_9BACT|nr:beta-ketoacyl synthase N-terminal-like domain-containing protein [Hymenobacter busanensis]KAA9339291.1 beta-ketoacyl-ACP reductase [Hymenobacter busanensis]QHJ06947.1 beta-ketoacyl-ACP reductase [Hymenobacter busanensis]